MGELVENPAFSPLSMGPKALAQWDFGCEAGESTKAPGATLATRQFAASLAWSAGATEPFFCAARNLRSGVYSR